MSAETAKLYVKETGFKLPPRFKERWLEALRSGDYPKTTGKLCRSDYDDTSNGTYPVGFCCLGVAGRIQGIPENQLSDYGFLDEPIIEIANKRKKQIPRVLQETNPVTEYLATLNDESPTFKKVIRWIDKNL